MRKAARGGERRWFILAVVKPRFYTPSPPWVTLLWWLDRWRWWCFTGLVVLYGLGINGRWRIASDSALYVLQAREIGHGPEAATDWGVGATPPGLPAIIAAAGGSANGITTGFMLAITALVLWLTYRLFVEHADRPTATLMVMLVGLSGLVYEVSFRLLTELPFMAGLLLVLWGHERRLKRKDGLAWALGMMAVGVLWMAAFRSVAAVVVGAYVLAEIVRVIGRGDQRRLGFALIGLATAAGILLWAGSAAIRDDAGFFLRTLGAKSPEAWWMSVSLLMTEALPEAVFGQDVPPILAWPTSLLAVAAMVMLVRARLLWGVLLGVMLVQWVVFLSNPRYVLPVLPLVLFGVWRSGVGGLGRWGEPWRGIGFGVLALAVVGANVSSVVNLIGEQRSAAFYETYRSGKYAAVVELAEAIKQQTPIEAGLRVIPDVGLELAVLSERKLLKGPAEAAAWREGPVYWVGPAPATSAHEFEASLVKSLGAVIGASVDRRSGEVWQVRLIENMPE